MADDKGTQRLCLAATFWDRLMGLFPCRSSDEILLIAPCRSVHTFGMGYAIDIAFIAGVVRECAALAIEEMLWCLCGIRAKGIRERFERVPR